jgi:two-component system, cell cycle response regulator
VTSAPVVDPGQAGPVPAPRDDAAGARLLAEVEALETASRFAVDGIADAAERLAAAARRLQLPEAVMRAELVGAEMMRRRGDIAGAGREAQRVRRWAEEHGHDRLLARSSYILSAVFQELGDLAMALELAVVGVDLLGDAGAATERMDHLVRLADCLGLEGDSTAAEHYADVLGLARDCGDVEHELLVLNNWAYTEVLAGRYETALRISTELQTRSAVHAVPLGVGRLDTIARVLMGLGRLEEAAAVLADGLHPDVLEASSDGDAGADFLLTLAEVHRLLGRTGEAQRHLDESVRRCEEHGLTAIRVRARREQAELHAATGDFRAAFEEHKRYSDELGEVQSAQRDARARAVHALYEATEARRQSRRYRELSLRDPLTGLFNRRYVDDQLPRLLRAGDGRAVTVALADLDHFKRINDTCSHEVGDSVLRAVGELLEAAVPTPAGAADAGSFAARMGGEEFLLVLVDVGPREGAARLEALRRALRAYPWAPLTGDLPVTVSIGATTAGPGAGATPAELIGRADANLYRAKRGGRDRVVDDDS